MRDDEYFAFTADDLAKALPTMIARYVALRQATPRVLLVPKGHKAPALSLEVAEHALPPKTFYLGQQTPFSSRKPAGEEENEATQAPAD